MILSASRRTDIPRFYLDWLLNRFDEGFALVRNPMSRAQVSRVPLDRDSVDCIAFWTKDPAPLLERIERLERTAPAPFFVQFTLNAYGTDVEAGLPHKAKLVETFRALSRALGPERVVWRYSPVLVGGRYTVEHHLRCFEALADRLRGSTAACRLSFLDVYPKIAQRMAALGLGDVPAPQKGPLALRLAELGAARGIAVRGCGDGALDDVGLASSGCIDAETVARVAGVDAGPPRCAGRRGACRCVPSVDVGSYDTCANGCVYCYANPGAPSGGAPWRRRRYDPAAPMLCDALRPGDKVTDRVAARLPPAQPRLF